MEVKIPYCSSSHHWPAAAVDPAGCAVSYDKLIARLAEWGLAAPADWKQRIWTSWTTVVDFWKGRIAEAWLADGTRRVQITVWEWLRLLRGVTGITTMVTLIIRDC